MTAFPVRGVKAWDTFIESRRRAGPMGPHRRPMAHWRRKLGAGPEAARDVGQAMAKNPAALIIPATGSGGGFSAPGGSTISLPSRV